MSAKDVNRNVMGKGQRNKVVRKHLTCVVIPYSEESGFRKWLFFSLGSFSFSGELSNSDYAQDIWTTPSQTGSENISQML